MKKKDEFDYIPMKILQKFRLEALKGNQKSSLLINKRFYVKKKGKKRKS